MRLFSRALWRTTALRMAIIFMLMFGLIMGLGLISVYQATVGVLERQTRDAVEADLAGLADQYRSGGVARLKRLIDARVQADSRRDEVYMLSGMQYEWIAGNLRNWPDGYDFEEWIEFPVTRTVGGGTSNRQVMGMMFELRGGYHLLVGRDAQSQNEFRRLLINASFWIALVTLAVGLATGIVLARRVLKRVDEAALSGQAVAEGNLDRRLPLAGSGDEFDRLASAFNGMLDRIQNLMSGMRIATDSISHDVRRPLTRLRANLERSLTEPDGSASQAEAREAMGTALEDIDATVLILDNLLKIARAEGGVTGETWREVEFAQIVGDAVELYGPVAEEKGLRLSWDLRPAAIAGEPQLLAQAVTNLIDNALKFAPAKDGAIVVTCGVDKDDRAYAEVRDNGPGIAEADRQRATDRFVRLDDGSRATEGSGLGLSLVRAVAQMHGGEIALEDAQPGLVARMVLSEALNNSAAG